MKPSVQPCGSGMIQKQLGTAYDVVKEVRDNLDVIRDAVAILDEEFDHDKLTNRNSNNQHSISSITGLEAELSAKQQVLQSGVNIKTVSGQHLLGVGNVELTPENITGLDDLLDEVNNQLNSTTKIAGYFSAGFQFKGYNEVGVTSDGQWWSYNGALPFTVTAGTVPSEPNYTNRGDAALRSALADGSADIAGLMASELVSKTTKVFTDNFDAKYKTNVKPGRPLELIAHRGFRSINIENTAQAVFKSIQQGADSVEFDVQTSGNGVHYLFHDNTVDALTNGTGVFKYLTSSTIDGLTYDKSGGKYLSQGIPRLTKVLPYLSENRVYCYPEIKTYRTLADVNGVVDTFDSVNMLPLTCFQSFELAVVQKILDEYPTATAGFLIDNNLAAMQSAADTLSVYPYRALLLCNYTRVLENPSIVEYCRSRFVDIGVYTVNSQDDIKELMAIGVYKIMSDTVLTGAQK